MYTDVNKSGEFGSENSRRHKLMQRNIFENTSDLELATPVEIEPITYVTSFLLAMISYVGALTGCEKFSVNLKDLRCVKQKHIINCESFSFCYIVEVRTVNTNETCIYVN